MAEWSEAQVSEWISLIDLPDGCAEAVQTVFADVDGEELLGFIPKTLQKVLRLVGVQEPKAAAKAILQQRNRVSLGAKPTAGEAPECPLCMEPYAEDDSELHVPRILNACGHTACQGCLALMLRTADAEAHVKKLPCPTCREVTEVKQGKASNLLKNFSLLR